MSRFQGISKSLLRSVELSLEEMEFRSFTGALKTHEAKLVDISNRGQTCQFLYTVPRAICKRVKYNDTLMDILPASSAIAVLDDLSAYVCVTSDRNRRPGVSVMLSVDIFKLIHSGQEVIAKFHADKIGKAMGFITMEFIDPLTQEVLARGKHIKYMDMGMLYNLLTQPIVTSLFFYFYDNYQHTTIGKTVLAWLGFGRKSRFPALYTDESTGVLFNSININRIAEDFKLDDDHDGDTRLYSMTVNHEFKMRPGMQMILGQLHGGCCAMLVENSAVASLNYINDMLKRDREADNTSAALSSANNLVDNDDGVFLQTMRLQYLAPLKVH